MLFLSIAIMSWSAGTVYSKKHTHKSNNIALNLFYQFSISSIIQFVLAFIFSSNTDVNTWSLRSITAVLYLAIFGSVLAFFCYYYALKRVTVLQVSILNYINIVIAIFLGWLVLDEIITFDFIMATALIIMGVFIINYKKNN
jgi:drug/metabolite transporter (DMT)-like permease